MNILYDQRSDTSQPFNWGLLLVLAICVEFWVIATSYVAQSL